MYKPTVLIVVVIWCRWLPADTTDGARLVDTFLELRVASHHILQRCITLMALSWGTARHTAVAGRTIVAMCPAVLPALVHLDFERTRAEMSVGILVLFLLALYDCCCRRCSVAAAAAT